jgi:hypothetical protein
VIETREANEPLRDVEAIVRAAGHYVRASDDLRPRVLEAARAQCGEQRAQRCIRHLAVFCLLLAMFTSFWPSRLNLDQPRAGGMLIAAGFNRLLIPPEAAEVRHGDGDWRLIEAFTELRRQQAQVLRSAL